MQSKSPTAIICLSPHAGGMEIDAIKLAKKLSPFVKITLIAKKGHFIADATDDYLGYNGIEMEPISFYSSISTSIIFRVRHIVHEKGIKNVIFFGASELKSLYFSFLGLNINLIVRHGTTKSRPKKDWFHRLIYSNVNYHISISKHLQQNVEYIIPFGKHSRSVMIYPSFELSNVIKTAHDKLTLLHIGRIAEGKGQADAIQACHILYENQIDFIFYIVGGFDKKYEQHFMELYNSLPYKTKIILVGYTKQVDEYYAKSDIFLFPSHGEGFGNAFLEALSHNLICLTYANTSFLEFQALGLVFHMSNHKNINKLQNMLLNTIQTLSEEQCKIVDNRSVIEKYFNPQTEIQSYLNYLR